MTLEQEYTQLLEKSREKEIIPFLQKLTPEERRLLAPLVKKLGKEYFAFQQEGNTWRSKATDKQRTILYYAFFVCYNEKEIRRENPSWLLCREHLEKFLPWYCPNWLNNYINSFGEAEWIPYYLDYDYTIELTQQGILQPVPRFTARQLVPVIHERNGNKTYFAPEKLVKYDVTLKEHVWHLFQYETDIHYSNRYLSFEGKEAKKGWQDVFYLFVKNGKLDKQRVLREALLAANRNFNKNLSGWFADLFFYLEPGEEEIVLLQPELFNLFSSPHSKVVNTALQGCKVIIDKPSFDTTAFLDSVPVLLASDTKSVVASTLQLLEKLAKKHAGMAPQICQLTTGAFIHRDESLQTRTAKLIQKFGNSNDEMLKEMLGMYSGTLFSAANTLLAPFMTIAKAEEESVMIAEEKELKGSLTDDSALPLIQDIDELVFLASQAFDNNQSWHIDLLPATLLRLQHEIKGEHIVKFEPAIQRALKLYFGDWRSNQGVLDQLLASFFLDYCIWMMGKHPEETASSRALVKTFMYKTDENKKVWDEHGTNTSFLAGWRSHGEQLIYMPYKKLLDAVAAALKNGQNLPLLCAPTHAPAWINPAVLVERLHLHLQQSALPDDTDLQIAISRCWLHDTTAAMQLAKEKLTGEWKALMLFLFDKEQLPIGPFSLEAAWMMAALTKSPQTVYPELATLSYSRKARELYTGNYSWQTGVEAYETNEYNWINGNYTTKPVTRHRKVIRLDLSAQKMKTPQPSGFKKLINKLTGKDEAPAEPPSLLFDYLRLKDRWMVSEDRDIRRLYLLTPNNAQPWLALTMEKCLDEPTFTSETHKRFVTEVLQVVHDTGMPSGEMAHLFIATCMIASDKTIATYAAEIWIQAVQQDAINVQLTGTILGRHQRIEFAPLKRFTDLLVASMLGVSSLHNRSLETLLTAMLKELPQEPVKGLKKLLEIYFEVLRFNHSSVKDEDLKNLLQKWKGSNTLNKVLKATV